MSSYQALYRKWRPLRFEDIVGQKHVSDTLKTVVESGRVAHAYLFCGTRGTGKTSAAKILSRAVNCENPQNGEPCNECATCLGILGGSIPDVYEMDAASNRGVDNIREICDEVAYIPIGCKKKIYIIDEVHMLTEEAFNALLKTIEEPPSHVIFILATTEPHRIPRTVLSRCQRFDFRRIEVEEIAARLKFISNREKIDITPDGAELLAELGDGSMRDAISLLDRCSAFGEGTLTSAVIADTVGVISSDVLFDIGDAVSKDDATSALNAAIGALNKGREAKNLLESVSGHFRSLLLCKAVDDPAKMLEKSDVTVERFKSQAKNFPAERLIFSIRTIDDYIARAKWMNDPKVAVEMAMVKLCMPSYSTDTQALIARIESLEAEVANLKAMGVRIHVNTSNDESKDINKPQPSSEKTDDNNETTNTGQMPPWDVTPKDAERKDNPKEISDDKNMQPVRVTDKAADKTFENGVVAGGQNNSAADFNDNAAWEDWPEALSAIKEKSKILYSFLYNANACLVGNTVEIEVEGEFAYNKISTPNGIAWMSAAFSRVSGREIGVKVYIKGQRDRKEDAENTALSINDLAKKKDVFGGKINIE